jgi:hypothetical protein
MSENTDVLVRWADMIDWAGKWADYVSGESFAEQVRHDYQRCIAALAAALRAERKRVAELQTRVVDAEHGFKLALGEAGEYRRQLAELEKDAALGRLVRTMPTNTALKHDWDGMWWCGRNVRGEFGKSGDTPEDALGRLLARCKDCALRVESGPLAGECHYDPDPRPANPACAHFEALRETRAGRTVTTDDALRVWMQRMEQALDVRLATALACITELEEENAALRRKT